MRVPYLSRNPGIASELVPRKSPPVDRKNGHITSLSEFHLSGGTGPTKKKRSTGPRSFARSHVLARESAQECIGAKSWSCAPPTAIVGLYSLLHERVYGIAPAELDGPDYRAAIARAKSVSMQLTPQGAYEFVRWTWKRAEVREQQKKDDADDGFRIGWRYQFSASMITNFKVAQARAGKKL